MKSPIIRLGLPAALLSASLFAACQNTARGVEQDAEQNAARAREEARETSAEARQEARDAGAAAERTGDRVATEAKEATRSVGATLDAAAQTMEIKTALIDADNLDANDIDVDTNATTKTVTLNGHVPSAAQKAAADRIAKEKAPEYRIVNNLALR
jgi:osmotically-inducible protein OsmY